MHNSYIIQGVVDGAVVKEQAFKRANDNRHPEPTAIHFHRHGEICNNDCYLVPVGAKKEEPAS